MDERTPEIGEAVSIFYGLDRALEYSACGVADPFDESVSTGLPSDSDGFLPNRPGQKVGAKGQDASHTKSYPTRLRESHAETARGSPN